MKIKEILAIMSLLGSLTQSSKLLKVPRVYNALVTSDENLQPSQAYPALAPVVQGIQYPGYVSSNVYRMLVVPSQVQYSDTRSYSYSVHNTVKEDYYQYNIVETGRPFQFDLPKLPVNEVKGVEEPTLFRPVVPVQDGNTLTADNGNVAKVNTDRIVYFESSPVQPDDEGPQDLRALKPKVNNVRSQYTQLHEGIHSPHVKSITPDLPDESATTETEEQKTNPRFEHYTGTDGVVKNYRPKDSSIADIPPPPVPVGRKRSQKPSQEPESDASGIEEYPPPPVGFL